MDMDVLEWSLWSDGSCYPNPGDCSGAWVIYEPGKTEPYKIGSRYFWDKGTNNIAELLAVKYGLDDLPPNVTVTVYTDSKYVIGPHNWQWRKRTNLPYWVMLDESLKRHEKVKFYHVRGHKGVFNNELVDKLASIARKETRAANDAEIDKIYNKLLKKQ